MPSKKTQKTGSTPEKTGEEVKSPRRVEFEDGLIARETNEVVTITVAPSKMLVDKVLFARAVKAIVQGIQGGKAYSNRGGITKFGFIMGATNADEAEKAYQDCLAVVEEDNERILKGRK